MDKLGYSWDKIHDLAEQLEHIESDELVDKLDKFLGYPKFDPHGDPIPDSSGKIQPIKQTLLSKLKIGEKGKVVGVKDSSSKLLQHLDSLQIQLGTQLELVDIVEFDNSVSLLLDKKRKVTLSKIAAQNIFIG